MTPQRAVGSDMWGVCCGVRSGHFGCFVDSSPWLRQTLTDVFFADCCGVNNSTVLLLRLHVVCQALRRRPYIPRFLSQNKPRRAAGWLVYWWAGLKAVLCSSVEKLTPQHVALEIWSEASSVRASQMPNAMLTKGQHWQNVLLWICSEDVFQTMNRIQYDSDVSPPGGSIVHLCSFVQPCVMHMWVSPVSCREGK